MNVNDEEDCSLNWTATQPDTWIKMCVTSQYKNKFLLVTSTNWRVYLHNTIIINVYPWS